MGEAPKVKLFSLSTCSHCKAAKTLLDRHHVNAEVTDVDRLNGKEVFTIHADHSLMQ